MNDMREFAEWIAEGLPVKRDCLQECERWAFHNKVNKPIRDLAGEVAETNLTSDGEIIDYLIDRHELSNNVRRFIIMYFKTGNQFQYWIDYAGEKTIYLQ